LALPLPGNNLGTIPASPAFTVRITLRCQSGDVFCPPTDLLYVLSEVLDPTLFMMERIKKTLQDTAEQ
jgi:hypothetical protein